MQLTITGFQKEIGEKVYGFWGHIHIKQFDFNYNYAIGDKPINKNQNFYPFIDTIPEIRNIQVYANKAGIIKTKEDIEGIVLKGIGSDYNWEFFKQYLIEGDTIQIKDGKKNNNIILSSKTAQRLKLKLGDDVVVYFIQKPARVRKFKLKGIYNTGLEEFDKIYALVDIAHIQKLNGWTDNQVGGFQVFLNSLSSLDEVLDYIYYNIIDLSLNAKSTREINPNIFDWLDLQSINQQVILILMILVAAINLITTLLILILERTNMIGILKAIGASNIAIQNIFLYNILIIISMGLFFGNIIGIGLSLIQKHFNLISLPEASYYLTTVPVNLDPITIIALNVGVLIINALILFVPSLLVRRISPIKAIRFD